MELLTPSEAAEVAGVHERTLRKWARAGVLTRHLGPDGRPGYTREEVAGLAAQGPPEGRTGAEERPALGRNGAGPPAEEVLPMGDKVVPFGTTSPELLAIRAQLAALEHERDTLAEHSDFLRQQLQAREDARREELQRRDLAEAELRRLLLTAQNALQIALEQRALPAASSISTVSDENPKRARWWFFGRR